MRLGVETKAMHDLHAACSHFMGPSVKHEGESGDEPVLMIVHRETTDGRLSSKLRSCPCRASVGARFYHREVRVRPIHQRIEGHDDRAGVGRCDMLVGWTI